MIRIFSVFEKWAAFFMPSGIEAIHSRLSIVRLFTLFIGISVVLFLVMTLSLLLPKIDQTFDSLKNQSDQAVAKTFAAQLERYIEDRELSLNDMAASQYVVNSVLLSDGKNPALRDYIVHARLLGEDPILTILDVEMKVLFSELGEPNGAQDYQWALPVLNEKNSQRLNIISSSRWEQFEIAVPIIYGRGNEGVMVARFGASPNKIFQSKTELNEYSGVVYAKDARVVQSDISLILHPHKEVAPIDKYGISLTHVASRESVIQQKKGLIQGFLYSVLSGSVVVFALLYFLGRRIIVYPYRELVETQQAISEAVEGISKIDPQGCYTYVNHAYAGLAGYTPDELKGKPWSITVFPDDLEMLNASYQTMLDKGKVTVEARGVKKGGFLFYKQVTMISRYNSEGEFIGHHCFMQDISPRKYAEKEQKALVARLAESNAGLAHYQKELEKGEVRLTSALNFQSLVFENIPDMIFVKDEKFRIVQANHSFLNAYPEEVRDSVIGTTSLEKYKPNEAEEFLKYDREAFEKGFSEVEETVLFPDGVVRTLDTKKVRFQDGRGQRFVLGVARDVTDLIKAQSLLKKSEERYEIAVQGSSVGLWDFNIVTGKLFWSDRFKDMMMVSDEEFVPALEEFTERLHPEDKERVLLEFNGHLNNKTPYDVEYRLRRNDGDYIWIHAKGQALWSDNDEAIRVAGSVNDISDRKNAEIEKENLIDKLAESNEWLEQFAFACSHDLQEPLRIVHTFSDKLKAHIEDQLQNDELGQRYFNYIMDGSSRAQTLIADILSYSRIDQDAEQLKRVNIEGVIGIVEENLQDSLAQVKGKITCDSLPHVVANQTQLYQLFQNLINNGLKYQSKQSCPRIHIGSVDLGGYWQFSVKDNGIGIADCYQKQVFDVFKRLHGQTEYSGTGVGLAICKKIVERHGGDIWVESEEGKGSVFHFTLIKSDSAELPSLSSHD